MCFCIWTNRCVDIWRSWHPFDICLSQTRRPSSRDVLQKCYLSSQSLTLEHVCMVYCVNDTCQARARRILSWGWQKILASYHDLWRSFLTACRILRCFEKKWRRPLLKKRMKEENHKARQTQQQKASKTAKIGYVSVFRYSCSYKMKPRYKRLEHNGLQDTLAT